MTTTDTTADARRVSRNLDAVVVCVHSCADCRQAGCHHAWGHRVGIPSLNGLFMGDCTDERLESVCCIPGSVRRVHCAPAHNAAGEVRRNAVTSTGLLGTSSGAE